MMYITYSSSPLSRSLVKLTRHNFNTHGCDCRHPCGHDYDAVKEDCWLKYLYRPKQLVRCIRRYHCAESKFFVITCLQFVIMIYLGIKALFHRFITGADSTLAEYYADRYFPRIHQSSSEAHRFDSILIGLIAYIFLRRLLRLYVLIKNSIINRNGYKKISASQVNLTAGSVLIVPLEEFANFLRHMLNHHKESISDPGTRHKHLSLEAGVDAIIQNQRPLEFIYLRNPISFSDCYGKFEAYFDLELMKAKTTWLREWRLARPLARIDPTELFWLYTIGSMVLLLIIIGTVVSNLSIMIYELCALADDNNENSCLLQIPSFLTKLTRIIRAFDLMALVMIQIPLLLETTAFVMDCSALISRVRKVREIFERDIERCHAKIGALQQAGRVIFEYQGDDHHFNRTIRFHIQLVRCVYQEFLDLRFGHTVFLNVLLIGGGLVSSLSTTGLLKSSSLFKRMRLGLLVGNCALEMGFCVLLCLLSEKAVSIMRDELAGRQLMTNSRFHSA